MFQSLVNDLVQRRLWPIPVAAVLVIIAVPLLFMKSSDGDSPAPAAPAAVQSDKLPDGADTLLSPKEREVDNPRRGGDPFAAPASAKPEGDAPGASGATADKPAVGSVVVSQSKAPARPAAGGVDSPATKPRTRPKAAKPERVAPKVDSGSVRLASVNVRYGATKDGKMLRTIPERKTFRVGDDVVAVFIRYSPKRGGAMFAVPPGITVSGPVNCERVDGVCRYVVIPDGDHVRLSYRRGDGTRVTRRLDVGVKRIVAQSEPVLPAAKLEQGNCLLKKLLNLPARALSLPAAQCS